MRKFFFVSLIIFSILVLLLIKKEKSINHKVIEKHEQLIGNQLLNEINNITIPYSKQGFTLHLPKSNPKGTLIFLSGSSMDTTRTMDEFDIIKPALKNDIAVLFISTGKVIEFLFTDEDIQIVDNIIGDALESSSLIDKPKILAGMSLGGTMALRYSEFCILDKSNYKIKPNALVICDAPLDMVRLWNEQEQAIKNNFHPNAVAEAEWVLYFLKKHLGGTPKEAMKNYINYSPFVYLDKNNTKIKIFKNLPIRMYHEPDINWWIKNRAKDYNTINSIDLAGFYNNLNIMGNTEVELITSFKKRKDYEKGASPHTWTIVNNDKLIAWILRQVKKISLQDSDQKKLLNSTK